MYIRKNILPIKHVFGVRVLCMFSMKKRLNLINVLVFIQQGSKHLLYVLRISVTKLLISRLCKNCFNLVVIFKGQIIKTEYVKEV